MSGDSDEALQERKEESGEDEGEEREEEETQDVSVWTWGETAAGGTRTPLGFEGTRRLRGFREVPSHEASVYAHGLHGAGFHDVVQGHIPSRQGSLESSGVKPAPRKGRMTKNWP